MADPVEPLATEVWIDFAGNGFDSGSEAGVSNLFAGLTPTGVVTGDIGTTIVTPEYTTDEERGTHGSFHAGVKNTGTYTREFRFTLPTPTLISSVMVRAALAGQGSIGENSTVRSKMHLIVDGVEYPASDPNYFTPGDTSGWDFMDGSETSSGTFYFPPTTATNVGLRETIVMTGLGYVMSFQLYEIAGLSGDTPDDDITPYVRKITFQRGGQFDLLGGQTPGKATIIVNNYDGRWNDKNADGPYFGRLRPGLSVWIGMHDSSDPVQSYGLFAGYVEEIAPVPGKDKRAEIMVTDPLGTWQGTPVAVEYAADRSVSEFREAILDALDVPSASQDLDLESERLSASGCRSDNALAVLEELNKSFATKHWIEPAPDKADFWTYRTLNRNKNLGFTSDGSLSEDDIVAMDGYRTTRSSVVNSLNVSYSPVKWPLEEVEVWKSDGPISMPMGTTRMVVEFSNWVKGISVQCTYENPATGEVAVYNYGKAALIELRDTTGSNAALGLALTGYQVNAESYQPVYESTDADSQSSYGKKAGSAVSGEYIQNSSIAQAVGDAVVFRSRQPRTRPSVRIRNRYDKFLAHGMYSVVSQSLDELSLVDEQYEIIGLSGTIAGGDTLRDFSWTYLGTTIGSGDETNLFTLDVSVLDGTDVLGF